MINSLRSKDQGINLMWLVSVVIAISLFLVIFSFLVFVKSGAYLTVKQISAASNSLAKDDLEDYDTTSPIQSQEIEVYSKTVNLKVRDLNDLEAFSSSSISSEALGY